MFVDGILPSGHFVGFSEATRWQLLADLALPLAALGDGEAAAHIAREAIELNPTLAYVWNVLATALVQQQQFDEATEAMDAAIRLEPFNFILWRNLAVILLHRGLVAKAEEAAAAAVAIGEAAGGAAGESLPSSRALYSHIGQSKATGRVLPNVDVPMQIYYPVMLEV
eukprot:GHVT01080383.1.p1 GENE.GHVT01080383.1~~GHVT01080383.1.p1  ORF type:complete len:168 (+),score=45.95 GHVT01080383.1:487-990(+)